MRRQNEVVVRINEGNINHHLYLNNHSTYWVHFSRHNADYTKARVRVSLRTKDINLARMRRDELFSLLEDDATAADERDGVACAFHHAA